MTPLLVSPDNGVNQGSSGQEGAGYGGYGKPPVEAAPEGLTRITAQGPLEQFDAPVVKADPRAEIVIEP